MPEEKETARLETFSDGVYAIAMTLLALDLKVPHVAVPTAAALATELARQWPSYLAFVTSFFTILIMWVNHHAMFKHIGKVNARLLFANGFLLLLTTTVPFTSALVAEYLLTPSAKIACAVYAGTFVLLAIAFNLVWHSAAHDRALLKPDADAQKVRNITRNYSFGPFMYAAATTAAFFSVTLCMLIISGLWIFWSVTTKKGR